MKPIRPLLYDKAPRWTDETATECGCDFCQHWSPLIDRIRSQLDDEGKTLFNELVTQWIHESDDLSHANAQLNGSWPGWEKMKDFKPSYEPVESDTTSLPQGEEPSPTQIKQLMLENPGHSFYSAREELREKAYGGKPPGGFRSWGDYWKSI